MSKGLRGNECRVYTVHTQRLTGWYKWWWPGDPGADKVHYTHYTWIDH